MFKQKRRTLLMLTIFVALILCISAASANDINSTNNIKSTNADNLNNDINIIAEENSFNDIQDEIDKGSSIIYLNNKTYIPNSTTPIPLIINNDVTIYGGSIANDGKFSTLDAQNLTQIMRITGGSVTLYNTILKIFLYFG